MQKFPSRVTISTHRAKAYTLEVFGSGDEKGEHFTARCSIHIHIFKGRAENQPSWCGDDGDARLLYHSTNTCFARARRLLARIVVLEMDGRVQLWTFDVACCKQPRNICLAITLQFGDICGWRYVYTLRAQKAGAAKSSW